MQLVIGNRNYSSWSLRGWLALRFLGFAPEVVRIPLFTPGYREQLRRYSLAGQVPVLVDDGTTVWDSLAIAEYAAERSGRGWPEDAGLRAHACASVCEMHAGFAALRGQLPMNIRARRRIAFDETLQREIDRVVGLWCEALTLHDGAAPGLYGDWGIADAFWAPVAFRFRTYGVAIPELCLLWMERLFDHPEVRAWCELAETETEVIDGAEVGEVV